MRTAQLARRGGDRASVEGDVGVSTPARPVLHTLWILSPPLWITLGTGGGQVGSGVWITRAPLGILEGAS